MISPSAKFKICLIVDNPARDLDSLVIVAHRLANHGFDTFLVPMYSVGFEVPAIAPDFVLFNYARSANSQIIKSFHSAGIGIGVLDTEGGIWESVLQFVKSIAHEELHDFLDQYYVWGPIQREALLEHTQLNPSIVFVTGSPRYDYCIEPWISAIPAYQKELKNYNLIISNFTLAYPRYATPETEIKNMSEAGYESGYLQDRINDEIVTRVHLVELIKKISQKFSDQIFVVRTHPFEDESDYLTIFKDYANIKIVREGTVAAWLKQAKLVLHFNSSVAVDATLMRIPVYSLDWISTNVSRGSSELPRKISITLKNEEQLFQAIRGETLLFSTDFPERNKFLHDWFYLADGQAHSRVAALVRDFLNSRGHSTDLGRCKKMFYYGSRNVKNWKGMVDAMGRSLLGAGNYQWVRNNILTKNFLRGTKSDKFFKVAQVNLLLEKLNQITSSKVLALPLSAAVKNHTVGDSVYIPATLNS